MEKSKFYDSCKEKGISWSKSRFDIIEKEIHILGVYIEWTIPQKQALEQDVLPLFINKFRIFSVGEIFIIVREIVLEVITKFHQVSPLNDLTHKINQKCKGLSMLLCIDIRIPGHDILIQKACA